MSSMYPFGGAAVRPCVRCGAQLALKESQCSRCGTYNPPVQEQGRADVQSLPGQGTSGLSWDAQSQFRQTGQQAWSDGNTGGTGGWPQQHLFADQRQQAQQPLSARQFQQNIFGSPPGPGFGDPNQSALGNSFASFQQNVAPLAPNSFPGEPWQNGYQADPNQSALGNSFASFQSNPAQSSFLTAPRQNGYQADPSQSAPGNSFASFQQNAVPSAPNSFLTASQQTGYQRPAPWSTAHDLQARPGWPQRGNEDGGKQKKGPGAGVVLVIAVLLVLLLGGGAFAGYKVLTSHNNAANPANTPAVATPSTPPLFRDTFQKNTAGWDLAAPTGAMVTLAGGKMVMESDNNKLYQEPFPGGKTYGDFRLDIDAGLTEGDPKNGYGVYVRGASAQDDPLGLFYRFEIYGDGYFYIYKGSLDANGNLQVQSIAQSQQPSDAVNLKGQMNHLTIIAKGPKLTWIINGTTVANLIDNSYKSGTMALFVSNVSKVPAGAQATFQNLAIFPAP